MAMSLVESNDASKRVGSYMPLEASRNGVYCLNIIPDFMSNGVNA